MPLGVWEAEPPFESMLMDALSDTLVSEARLIKCPLPIPFFCLNFSSQLELFAFMWLSVLPTVVAKKCAFSLITASVKGIPFF